MMVGSVSKYNVFLQFWNWSCHLLLPYQSLPQNDSTWPASSTCTALNLSVIRPLVSQQLTMRRVSWTVTVMFVQRWDPNIIISMCQRNPKKRILFLKFTDLIRFDRFGCKFCRWTARLSLSERPSFHSKLPSWGLEWSQNHSSFLAALPRC